MTVQNVRDALGWAESLSETMAALANFVGTLEKRLTALEVAKPQAGSEQRVARLQRDAETQYDRADTAEAEVKRLTAELAAARAERDNFAEEAEALTRQRDSLGAALDKAAADVKYERERNAALVTEIARLNTFLAQQAAMVKERMYERDTLGAFVDALKADNKRLENEVEVGARAFLSASA